MDGKIKQKRTFDVFISYKSDDVDVISKIRDAFDERGIRTWMDIHNIQGGFSYPKEIVKGISESNLFLVFISEASIESEHVKSEVNLAFSDKKFILPCNLDNTELNDEFKYYLARYHCIFMSPDDNEYKILIEGLAKIINNELRKQNKNEVENGVVTKRFNGPGWGPGRPTFTDQNCPDAPVFNSKIDNGEYGDERSFLLVKDDENKDAGGFVTSIEVEQGHTYLIRALVHNNFENNSNQIAENVSISASVDRSLNNGLRVEVLLSSSNATPNEIWSSVFFHAERDFQLTYVGGSGKYYTNANPNGFELSDKLSTQEEGVLLGYDKLDGKIGGGYQFSGIATFKVKATFAGTPNFTVDTMVRVKGDDSKPFSYSKYLEVEPGETVRFKITYVNTGDVNQENIIASNVLPRELQYILNSSILQNACYKEGTQLTDGLFNNGIDIGGYIPDGNARIYFDAIVPEGIKRGIFLENRGMIETQNGWKESTTIIGIKVQV